MTDADRIARATQSGRRMLGPAERQRCHYHPRRWMIYRWTWAVDDGPDGGDAEVVRGCAACADEAA